VSALLMPRTEVPVTPAVSTHVHLAPVAVPLTEKAWVTVESNALKYLDGRAMVILPPVGMGVTTVKPTVIRPVLTVLCFLSLSWANDMAAPAERVLPRAIVFAAALSLSVDVETVKAADALWGSNPVVMAPMGKVRVWDPAARTSTAVVQTTVSFVTVPVAALRTQVAVVLPEKVTVAVADTADK